MDIRVSTVTLRCMIRHLNVFFALYSYMNQLFSREKISSFCMNFQMLVAHCIMDGILKGQSPRSRGEIPQGSSPIKDPVSQYECRGR